MNHEHWRRYPTVILLLNRVRRVSEAEARAVVEAELGAEAANTVRNQVNMGTVRQYIDWKLHKTPYHIGTASEPYINRIGIGKCDDQNRLVGPMKYIMREEVPPEDEASYEAWMAHAALLYVDALDFHGDPEIDDTHQRNVLRIAGRFVDERCVLLWLPGVEPKNVVLPSSEAIAALRAGVWPGRSIKDCAVIESKKRIASTRSSGA